MREPMSEWKVVSNATSVCQDVTDGGGARA